MSDMLQDTVEGCLKVFGLMFVIWALAALTQCSINQQVAKEGAIRREAIGQTLRKYAHRNDYLHKITMVPKTPINDSWIKDKEGN